MPAVISFQGPGEKQIDHEETSYSPAVRTHAKRIYCRLDDLINQNDSFSHGPLDLILGTSGTPYLERSNSAPTRPISWL